MRSQALLSVEAVAPTRRRTGRWGHLKPEIRCGDCLWPRVTLYGKPATTRTCRTGYTPYCPVPKEHDAEGYTSPSKSR